MKKYLLFASFLAASLVTHADQFQYGNAIYRTLDTSTCSLVKVVDGTSGKVEIPEVVSYTTYPAEQSISPRSMTLEFRVVEVDNTAFNGEAQANVTEVVLPESITKISGGAFYGCTSLTTVNIPSQVTELNSVFSHCTSLKRISIPQNVSNLVGSFQGCGTIEEIVIDDSENPIERSNMSYAFDNSSIKKIYQGRNIDTGAFRGKGIELLTIGDMVTEIYSDMYSGNPMQSITFGKNLTKIGRSAFTNCTELTEINLPESLAELGNYSFNGCSSLTTFNIPSQITEIEDNFNNCPSLRKVTIPKNIEKISSSFLQCGTIEELIIEDSENPIDISGFSETQIKSVYQGRNRGYDNIWFQNMGVETVVIGDMVTEIGSGIYSNNPLRNIAFGKNLKTIKYQAFVNCTELKEVILPESLVELENTAFYNCPALTSVSFPSKLTEINSNFNMCPSLHKVSIPANIEKISSSFRDCGEIEDFVIEDSEMPITLSDNFGYETVVRNLYLGRNFGDRAFENRKIENLILGDKVTELVSSAFSGSSLQTIKFDDNLAKIGNNAFYNCSQLKEVILPESLTELGTSSFDGCSSLTTLVISSKLKEIQQNFNSCKSLKKVIIPSNIESIEHSFGSCSIEEFIIEDGETLLTTDGGWTFNGSTVKSIYQGRNCTANAFSNRGVENLIIGDKVKELSSGLYSENPLKEITLGKSLAKIEGYVFGKCDDIEVITSYAEDVPECADSYVFSQAAYDSAKLMVPSGSRKAYAEAPVWKLFKHIGQSTCAVTFDYDDKQCSVALPEDFDGIVKSGESLTFTAVPLESFKITGVNADGEYKAFVQDEEGRWTLDSITGDVNVKIASEIITFAVTAKMNSEAGYLTINGETADSVRVAWGENAVIALTLNEGYKLDRFTVNGTDVTDRIVDGKLTLEAIHEDVAAEAVASLITYSFKNEFDAAHGTVTVGGNTATEQNYTYGSRPEIEILPDEGYCVSWARLNGNDIKSLLVDNRYTTDSIKSDMTLSVGFEARTLMLSVLGIEGGRVAGVYDYGVKARVKIIPDEGWVINTVVYNGTPVESSELVGGLFITPALTDDSEISVTFENPWAAVDNIEGAASDIHVYGYNRTIHIVNAAEGETVYVSDVNGRTVYSGLEREITMETGGVYLVTVSGRTFKLML